VEVETVACDFFAAGWRDGAAAAGARWGRLPPLGFAAMGLTKSSLLTYLAWTDETQRVQRLSPSPLRARYAAGREYCVGGFRGEGNRTVRTDGRRSLLCRYQS
jgi:hypothetical protein